MYRMAASIEWLEFNLLINATKKGTLSKEWHSRISERLCGKSNSSQHRNHCCFPNGIRFFEEFETMTTLHSQIQ